MDNFAIIVNKEKSYTSRDVVNCLNKIFKTKKIGHTGTLDPLATGVLVCLIGKYTKLVPYLISDEKEYLATIKLGIKTDTLDILGQVLEEKKPRKLDEEEIKKVLNNLKGEYTQTIPLYSAKHVNGKRLYEYALNNEKVELPTNKVLIKEIELINYENDTIKFRCVVSKGTYIRSLIQTICENLKVLGVMSELKRTRQGNFRIEKASDLENIANNKYQKLKIADLLPVQVLEIPSTMKKKIANGNKVALNLEGLVLFKENHQEKALYNFEEGIGHLILLLENS